MAPQHPQDAAYEASIADPANFWAYQAQQLTWHKQPRATYETVTKKVPPSSDAEKRPQDETYNSWSWFPDGELSTSYNCVTRHVEAGHGDRTAIIWDSPVTGAKERLTYAQLDDEIAVLAGALRAEGVRKGDVVLVYMPMIPAALIGILATVRLGAIHAVVFGGFSAASLAQRIESSGAKVILTASCGIEGAKGPLAYKPLVRGAIEQSAHKPDRVIVWQRHECRWNPTDRRAGERTWQTFVKSARDRNIRAENVPVKSSDGLYIIYTSVSMESNALDWLGVMELC